VCDALRGLRRGFFLDSGAGDGCDGSNTRLLEEAFGWSGICVEPNAKLFARLRTQRRCLCRQCCLYSRNDTVRFLEGAQEFGGIVEAFEPANLERARAAAARLRAPGSGVVDRRALRPLDLLLECRAPTVIDYWSLDTEGSELDILRAFPFDRFRVRVLTVEHNHGPVREDIRALLEPLGYSRAARLGIDDGYVLTATDSLQLAHRS
jgi:hypothetical protein